MIDYLENAAKDAAEMLRKQQLYVDLAIKNGDAAWIEKAGEVKIAIRLKPPKEQNP